MIGKRFQILAALSACCCVVNAEPFVPANDAVVLERLPKDFVRAPKNVAAQKTVEEATHEAENHIRNYQAAFDPRYLGYAQAALGPWWNDTNAPSATIVARASIKQSLHHFDAALKDLELVLGRDPRNAQAWLLRTTLLQVQGNLNAAAQSAARLAMVAPRPITMTSIASIAGVRGRGREALQALQTVLLDAGLPKDQRIWTLTIAAEIAERIDEAGAAEMLFKEALTLDSSHTYTLAAFSDFLIARGRATEAFELVQNRRESDALLLRRALALKAIGKAPRELELDRADLKERFNAARRRGDSSHLREEARAVLSLENDAPGALRLAIQNWEIQREPADLRILAEVAAATHDEAAIEKAVAWIHETKLEDVAVEKLLPL